MRILHETVYRICSDAALLRSIWEQYDARSDADSKVFTALISALNRLATEKPAVLGVSSQMLGVGVVAATSTEAAGPSSAAAYGLEVAGRVASAATAHVSNVVGLTGSDAGLSISGSAMKLQWYVLDRLL